MKQIKLNNAWMNNVNSKAMQVINFSTRDFNGSIDIDHVIKVVALPRLTMAPEAKKYIVGVMNIAGVVVPVIDLSMRLNTSVPTSYHLNTPVIICKTSTKQTLGVVVDQVIDIADVSQGMLDAQHDENDQTHVIHYAIKYGDKVSLLVDVDHLLNEQVHHGR